MSSTREDSPVRGELATRAAELEAFLAGQFPDLDTSVYRVVSVEPCAVKIRLDPRPEHLRPGGTLSGPTLMTLADVATYLAIVAAEPGAEAAVTTSLHIHFLRRPAFAELTAEARLLRLGRRSAVAEVRLCSAGETEPVAAATVAYSLPFPAGAPDTGARCSAGPRSEEIR